MPSLWRGPTGFPSSSALTAFSTMGFPPSPPGPCGRQRRRGRPACPPCQGQTPRGDLRPQKVGVLVLRVLQDGIVFPFSCRTCGSAPAWCSCGRVHPDHHHPCGRISGPGPTMCGSDTPGEGAHPASRNSITTIFPRKVGQLTVLPFTSGSSERGHGWPISTPPAPPPPPARRPRETAPPARAQTRRPTPCFKFFHSFAFSPFGSLVSFLCNTRRESFHSAPPAGAFDNALPEWLHLTSNERTPLRPPVTPHAAGARGGHGSEG
jgi:hypothetical protein